MKIIEEKTLEDTIYHIIEKNYNTYRGTTEAALHSSEEIADLLKEILTNKKSFENEN